MQQNKITILSTRRLRDATALELHEAGIGLEEHAFIDIQPLKDETLQRQVNAIADRYASIIFTSANAVEAVMQIIGDKETEWRFYCTAPQTQKKLLEYFSEERIAGMAPNARELAAAISEDPPKNPLVFFCGDQAREELPGILQKENIALRQVTVYKTLLSPRIIDNHFDGILFFSPSAVESYFSANQPGTGTVLFAVGETTAAALREKTNNEIMVADHPSEASMVKKIAERFLVGK